MPDGNPSCGAASRIPLQTIAEYRASFGAEKLSYQLELRLLDGCNALAAFALACARAGVDLHTLRCNNDRLLSTLVETATTDLAALEQALSASTLLALVRWTTVIDF